MTGKNRRPIFCLFWHIYLVYDQNFSAILFSSRSHACPVCRANFRLVCISTIESCSYWMLSLTVVRRCEFCKGSSLLKSYGETSDKWKTDIGLTLYKAQEQGGVIRSNIARRYRDCDLSLFLGFLIFRIICKMACFQVQLMRGWLFQAHVF